VITVQLCCVPTCTNQCVCVCVSVCVYLCVLRVLPYENRANRFLAHKGLCLCQVSMVNKISCTVNICNTTQL
jgi:hypothetical protein